MRLEKTGAEDFRLRLAFTRNKIRAPMYEIYSELFYRGLLGPPKKRRSRISEEKMPKISDYIVFY